MHKYIKILRGSAASANSAASLHIHGTFNILHSPLCLSYIGCSYPSLVHGLCIYMCVCMYYIFSECWYTHILYRLGFSQQWELTAKIIKCLIIIITWVGRHKIWDSQSTSMTMFMAIFMLTLYVFVFFSDFVNFVFQDCFALIWASFVGRWNLV